MKLKADFKFTFKTASAAKAQQLEAAKKTNKASAAAKEAVLNELRKTTHQSIQSE